MIHLLKPLELCLPCLLMLKVAVSFYGKIKTIVSLYVITCLNNHLSTESIGSFYSSLHVVTKPFNKNQRKAAFQDNKS